MARKSSEKTSVQITADAAREKYKKAKELFAKTNKPDDAKALATAKKDMETAVKAENAEHFNIVARIRIKKTIAALKTLAACSKRKSFDYSREQVAKAFAAIDTEIATAKTRFEDALSGKKETATEIEFNW